MYLNYAKHKSGGLKWLSARRVWVWGGGGVGGGGGADGETVEKFYEELQKAIDKKSYRHHIKMGDSNAKTGVRTSNNNVKCEVAFAIGKRKERGQRLLAFFKENIHAFKRNQTNTRHEKPKGWGGGGGGGGGASPKTKLTSWCFQIGRSQGTEVITEMVRVKVEIKENSVIQRKIQKQKSLKLDLRVLT